MLLSRHMQLVHQTWPGNIYYSSTAVVFKYDQKLRLCDICLLQESFYDQPKPCTFRSTPSNLRCICMKFDLSEMSRLMIFVKFSHFVGGKFLAIPKIIRNIIFIFEVLSMEDISPTLMAGDIFAFCISGFWSSWGGNLRKGICWGYPRPFNSGVREGCFRGPFIYDMLELV